MQPQPKRAVPTSSIASSVSRTELRTNIIKWRDHTPEQVLPVAAPGEDGSAELIPDDLQNRLLALVGCLAVALFCARQAGVL